MEHAVRNFALLLLVAAVVSILARRWRIPYTVGLAATGILLAWLGGLPGVAFTRDLIFLVLLPPLVFEAAFNLDWAETKTYWRPIAVLSTLGVGICTVTVAAIALAFGWEWAPALLLGILVSPTDPVAVVATFREIGVKGRLRILVEAESLFNDGTAAALFAIAVVAATGTSISLAAAGGQLVLGVAGGVTCGLAAGVLMLLLQGRTNDALVQTTCTTVAAYGSFLLAESFHVSGVLAALSAGILMGNSRLAAGQSSDSKAVVQGFWEYASFVANSAVFLLVGIRLANQGLRAKLDLVAVAIAVALIARAAAVYICCAAFRRPEARIPMAEQHVLVWGGLRGALGLALALGLPESVPHRDTIQDIVFAVAGFSILVQGLTIAPLLRRLGLVQQGRVEG